MVELRFVEPVARVRFSLATHVKNKRELGYTYLMIKGNFLGAAIVAILYTVYVLTHPLPTKGQMVVVLVLLNALTIVLMSFAFK